MFQATAGIEQHPWLALAQACSRHKTYQPKFVLIKHKSLTSVLLCKILLNTQPKAVDNFTLEASICRSSPELSADLRPFINQFLKDSFKL